MRKIRTTWSGLAALGLLLAANAGAQQPAPKVAVDHQAWWKRLRAVHHADYLQATLSSRSASNSRPRF